MLEDDALGQRSVRQMAWTEDEAAVVVEYLANSAASLGACPSHLANVPMVVQNAMRSQRAAGGPD